MDGKLIAQAGNLIRRESWRLERVTQNVCTIQHSLCVCVCVKSKEGTKLNAVYQGQFAAQSQMN